MLNEFDNEVRIQKKLLHQMKDHEINTVKPAEKIQGKKDDESMKTFLTRVRNDTRVALNEELKGLTNTSKKRKERLKERKKKRKGNAEPLIDEDHMQFGSASNGRIRPSDTGDAMEFRTADAAVFGQTPLAPPVLRIPGVGGKKPRAGGDRGGEGSAAGPEEDMFPSQSASAGKRFMEQQRIRAERAEQAAQLTSGGAPSEADSLGFSSEIAKVVRKQPTPQELIMERNAAIASYKQLQTKRKVDKMLQQQAK